MTPNSAMGSDTYFLDGRKSSRRGTSEPSLRARSGANVIWQMIRG